MPDEDSAEKRPRLGAYVELVFRPFSDAVIRDLSLDKTEVVIDVCEHVLVGQPGNLDALKALGDAYTRAERHVEGLRIDKRLVALAPDDPTVWYNLACSYALLGLKDQAFEALQRATAKGYDDFRHLVEDADLKSLHDDPRFDELLQG